MKKRGKEREKDFRVKIILVVLLVLIILVFLIGLSWNRISGRAVSESSAASNIDKISLSVATLKDKYKVKEKILLTDPPDKNIISGNVVGDGVLGSSFNNQIINGYDNDVNSNPIMRRVVDGNGNMALENEEIKSKGYIIEFEDKPLVLKEKELAPAGVAEISLSAKIKLKNDINKERTKIRTKRETIKNNIKTKLGKSRIKSITGNVVANPDELSVLGEYENVFNGIALDITNEEAEKIKTISGVKSVSPNLEVKALLMDSVPLIGADQVWNLDEDGNDCSISGKECLTGKGVTIGIIDTGVDYTHEDLGNSSLGERKYEKISKDSLSVGGGIHGVNQFLSMDKNRVAYFSKDKLYIYDFNSKETLEIDAASTNSTPAGLVFLRDNYLVYSAEILSSPIEQRYQLYMYDLNKKNYKFIDYLTHRSGEDTFTSSGFAKIEGDKVVYTKVVNANLSTFLIFYNRFVYDILSDEKVDLNFSYGLIYFQYPFITKNNKVYYQIGVNVGDLKTNELIIYDLLNKTYQTIDLPGLEILTDVSEDEIIYSLENSRDYRVYNLQYNTYFDVNGSREITSNNQTLESASNLVQSVTFYFRDAKFGEDFIAYNLMSNFVFGHINIYDKALNKYIKLNLKEEVSYFDVEGNRICFTTILNEIKCHTYNITEDYSFFALPVFNNKVIGGWDFVNNDNNPMDDHGHGTHVAGIAAGDGAGGLRGVAPDAELYGYKVLSASGSGSFADVMTAIERAVDPNQDGDFSDHLDIISMSLGGIGNSNDPVSNAVDNAVDAGVVAVIAAGNSGPKEGTIRSPGTARKAITVGATDKLDVISGFSSRGPIEWIDSQGDTQYLIKPDVVAPGVNVCSAQWDSVWNDKRCLDDEHVAISGTSMATPMVAGAVALLKQKHPDWSPDEIKMALRNSAIDLGRDINTQGYGRINILNAIKSKKPAIAKLYTSGFANGKMSIKGTASGENFYNYIVEYGKGSDPTKWVQICSSNMPRIDDTLCLNVSENIFYEGPNILKLTVSIEGSISQDNSIIYMMEGMQEGWPKKLDGLIFSTLVEDLDSDGNNEIIATTRSSTYLFDIWGNLLPGWPKQHNLICSGSCLACAAIGNFDSDNEKEVVVSSIQEVAIYKKNGEQVQGWPKKLDRIYSTCPTIGDIDNDSRDDIIVSAARSWNRSFDSKVFAFKRDGNLIYGWPINIPSIVKGTASIADINKDGFKKVILGGIFNGKVYIFNHNGTNFNGWPVQLDNSFASYSSPIIADLDEDGSLEIIAAGSVYLYVLDSNGVIKRGWPINIGVSIDVSPSIGDINKDGNLEIVLGSSLGGDVFILSKEGIILKNLRIRPGMIMIDGQVASSSVIGDIDGDNVPDIIQAPHSRTEIYAWNFNKRTFFKEIPGWPKSYYIGLNGPIATPVLSDIDNDGDMDILLGSRAGYLYIWDLDTNYNSNVTEWPMFQYDSQHTGLYKRILFCGNNKKELSEECDGIDNLDCINRCDSQCECLPRPQSKLTNVNSKPVTGTLRMYLQKKDKKGKWANVKKAVDRKITIPGKGLVKLDNGKDHNGKQRFKGWNNLNIFAKAKGDYRVYAVFVVGSKEIRGSWEFKAI